MFMKMKGSSNCHYFHLGMIAVLVILIINGTTLARLNIDETRTIKMGSSYAYWISMSGQNGRIYVNIQVINGGPVNTLLMSSSDYTNYLQARSSKQGNFNTYSDGTALDINSKTYSFTFPESGKYYIVIENDGFTKGGATPIGDVDVYVKISDVLITNVVRQTPVQTDVNGIIDNANRLFDDYKWKLDLVTEIQGRTDALGTSATKEMYIEWKRRNNEAIDAGERLATYLTENRDILDKGTDENWASNKLVFIAKNKVTLERDNQNLEQIINSFDVSQRTVIPRETNTQETPGFEAFLAIFIIVALVFCKR